MEVRIASASSTTSIMGDLIVAICSDQSKSFQSSSPIFFTRSGQSLGLGAISL